MTTNALPQIPRLTREPQVTSTDFTDLECYLALMTRPVEISASLAERRAQTAATRILHALFDHETDVLCSPEHVPGQRRANTLWEEIDVAAAAPSPSVRMVARMVSLHLGAHEEALVGDNRLPAPDPALDALVGDRLDAAVLHLDRTHDMTAVLDAVHGVGDYFDGPEPA